MTMRDRLAADLCPEFTADRRHARDVADRLIAKGWVRLDEDGLARAILRAHFGEQWPETQDWERDPDNAFESYSSANERAAAIIRALGEEP